MRIRSGGQGERVGWETVDDQHRLVPFQTRQQIGHQDYLRNRRADVSGHPMLRIFEPRRQPFANIAAIQYAESHRNGGKHAARRDPAPQRRQGAPVLLMRDAVALQAKSGQFEQCKDTGNVPQRIRAGGTLFMRGCTIVAS